MGNEIRIFTIGFAGKSAEQFFCALQHSGVKRLLDIRLNNTSQLAGFTKRDDLRYFLDRIAGIAYRHVPELAPTREILDAYKKDGGQWSTYETDFLKLLAARNAQQILSRDLLVDACFLCSEEKPDHCHRRLVAEYLACRLGNTLISHL